MFDVDPSDLCKNVDKSQGKIPKQSVIDACAHNYGRTSSSSVTSMLKNIGWEQLEERRAKSRVTMLYRIVNDLVDIPATDYLLQAPTTRKNGIERTATPRSVSHMHGCWPNNAASFQTTPACGMAYPRTK